MTYQKSGIAARGLWMGIISILLWMGGVTSLESAAAVLAQAPAATVAETIPLEFNPPALNLAQTTPPLLKPGATGSAVENLQQGLAQIGIFRLPIDGVYGPATVEAVEAFQRQQGLPIDGIVGPQTHQALALATSPQSLLPGLTFLGPQDLAFTPLVVASPDPPPSAFWLALMPLVPIVGGALTYLHRQLNEQRRRRRARRRVRRRNPPPNRLRGWLLLGFSMGLGLGTNLS